MDPFIHIATSANAAWNEAFNAKSSSDLAQLYAQNATLSPGNGKILVGREAIEGLFRSFIEAGIHDHALEIIEVGGSEKLVYQIARWSAKGVTSDGTESLFGGITTSILEQDASGSWRTRSHVWNAE